MKIRIACIQLNPEIGKLQQNVDRALKLIDSLNRQVDLIVLPELAFTGYNFGSAKQIDEYLEVKFEGITSKLARQISLLNKCVTVIGYPERTPDNKIYNSAVVSDLQGNFIHNYRKSFLYETDEGWGCSEGSGFSNFKLNFGEKSIWTSIGICMDLNPYKFEAPFNKYEFAMFNLREQVELILCPTAWLNSASPSITKDFSVLPLFDKEIKELKPEFNLKEHGESINPELKIDESKLSNPSISTLNYWILRFFPFLNYDNASYTEVKPTVVICNRSGIEKDVVYGGSSTIFKFNNSFENTKFHDSRNSSVTSYGSLSQGSEGVLFREVDI